MTDHIQGKQTRKNFYFNILALVANVVVGIYYTPYLVNELGLSAYGIVPIALIVNQYIGVASGTLTSAFTRFYSIDIQKGLFQQASKDISTSFFAILTIIAFCVPILSYLIYDLDKVFDIPSQYLYSAKLLFIFTILSFFVSLISSLLNVTLYALNRLDIITALNIVRIIFKFVFVIILFESLSVDVANVGLGSLLAEIGLLIASIYYFRLYKPDEINIRWTSFDREILMLIISMSLWILIQQIGDTFIYRTDNLVINHFWGTVASGAVGIVSEFGGYIRTIVNVIGSLFGPLVLLAYSHEDHDTVKNLAMQQSLIVGCLAAAFAGLCSGISGPLLELWINPDFGMYKWWLVIKLVVIPFYASGGILAFVYRAWNKVKIPAILTVVLGVLNLIIVIAISNIFPSHNTIYAVLIITALISFIQCYLINCICVGRIYKGLTIKMSLNGIKIAISFILTMLLG